MRGRRKYEIVEEVLARAYEFQDKLQYVRMPIKIGGEVSSRQKADGETLEQMHDLNRAYAALERYRSVADELAVLYAMKNRVSAVLGRPAAEPISTLQDLAAKVVFAIYQIPRTAKGQMSAGFGELDVGTISSPGQKKYMRAKKGLGENCVQLFTRGRQNFKRSRGGINRTGGTLCPGAKVFLFVEAMAKFGHAG